MTGVRHGLFSKDDTQLPPGWTRADSESVSSYFSQYSNIVGEDARIKFSSSRTGAVVPGRDFWRSWVTSNWGKWKIHSRIAELLTARDIHPVSLYQKNTDLKNKQVSNSYLPLILDDIGLSLYGPEALDSRGLLPYALRGPTQQLAQRTWSTLTKQISRSKQKFASLEAAARVAFEGELLSLSYLPLPNEFTDLDRDKLTKGKISTVIRAVQRWKAMAQLFDDPDILAKIDQMDDELRRLMEGLGAKVKAKAPKVAKEVPPPKRMSFPCSFISCL
jgi:TATA-binding protein-associated factor